MFCPNCSKLAFLNTKRECIRCQSEVLNNISVLCNMCSLTDKQCAVCLKKIIPVSQKIKSKGCNCGK